MFSRKRITGCVVSVCCLGAVCMFGSLASEVAGNTKTIVRSDYNKDDYLLFMTTTGQKGDPEPGEVGVTIDSQSSAGGRVPLFSWEIANGSGSPGDTSVEVNIGKNVTLPNPTNYYAVTGVRIDERNNRPCVLTLLGALVDPRYPSYTREVARYELERCKKVLPGKDSKTVDLSEDIHNFDARKQGRVFVSGMSVCRGGGILQNIRHSSAWEIKGIKVQPTEVKLKDAPVLEGHLVVSPDVQSFTRANCRKKIQATDAKPGWDNWSDCPTGQMVTGVRAYSAKDKFFTGLSANCKSVASRKISTPPVKDADGY